MKGILFTEDLFNKTITGQKTETRRFGSLSKLPGVNFLIGRILGKAYANKNGKVFDNERNEYKPRYKKGDTVYLKEPWLPHPNDSAKTLYKFDYKPDDQIGVFEKQPITRNEAGFNNKLFMPARRARHFVLIMSVWAERITHISEESAINEGFENKEQFFDTFNKINPKVDIQSAYNWVYQYKLINPKESDKIKIDHGIK